ncbi:MAG: glycosyltransferase [Candidatus Baltobacteraceae bacterium]
MRILVIPKDFPTPENAFSGIFILRRLQAMQERGHEVSVLRIVPHAPPFGAQRWKAYASIPRDSSIEGVAVRTVRAFIPPNMIGIEYLPLQLRGAAAREIRRVRADLVHASYLIPCGQLAIHQSVPSIVTMHGIDAHTWPKRRAGLRRATQAVLRQANQLTAVSKFLGDVVQEIERCDVRVIWNGADERFFFPQAREAARERIGLPRERFIITYAGVIDREKGVYDLLDAACAIRSRRPLLLIAGGGNESAAFERAAREKGVDVRMLGAVDQRTVATAYAAADVMTLPSYIEGLPNVVCEAMLCGRAVITTPAGGTAEIVKDGENGLLVPIGNPQRLAHAFERLADDPAERDRLAAAAHAFARERLTWRNSARLYEQLYEEVYERHRVASWA